MKTTRRIVIAMSAALILAGTAVTGSAEYFVDHDHPLIPVGFRPGDSFHLVFATGYADMWDGSIENAIALTQNLTTVPGAQAELTWTGGTSAGVAHDTYPLGNGTESALTGRASSSSSSSSSAGGGWIAGSGAERRGPTTSLRFYALSEKITINIPPDADGDGLPDWYELAHTDPSSSTALGTTDDPDQDGLTALEVDPDNEATEVATNAALTMTFDEDVTAGSGSIIVKNLTESTQSSIPVTDGNQVSVSGTTATITPAGGFIEGRVYAIQVAAGAIVDLSDNAY